MISPSSNTGEDKRQAADRSDPRRILPPRSPVGKRPIFGKGRLRCRRLGGEVVTRRATVRSAVNIACRITQMVLGQREWAACDPPRKALQPVTEDWLITRKC